MAFIAISLQLDMGGTEFGVAVGPSAAQRLMLLFVGRIVPIALAINHLLANVVS
jgi:hypothetical protein